LSFQLSGYFYFATPKGFRVSNSQNARNLGKQKSLKALLVNSANVEVMEFSTLV
jgi:hypothetical protein